MNRTFSITYFLIAFLLMLSPVGPATAGGALGYSSSENVIVENAGGQSADATVHHIDTNNHKSEFFSTINHLHPPSAAHHTNLRISGGNGFIINYLRKLWPSVESALPAAMPKWHLLGKKIQVDRITAIYPQHAFW